LLCSKPAGAKVLLDAVDRGKLKAAELDSDALQQILRHQDVNLEKIVEKHWGKIQPQTTGEKRARMHGIQVSLKLASGDRERGKALFKQHCGICHTLFGEGNRIGPDLTGADRKDLNFLLTSIVDPSAVIRKEYLSHVLRTADGQVLTGLIAESTPATITLLDAKNQRTTLARSDVESMKASPVSLMPEKILDALDAQQVRDLIAFIQSGK
jgi:putative heme-binding domain-containing protein